MPSHKKKNKDKIIKFSENLDNPDKRLTFPTIKILSGYLSGYLSGLCEVLYCDFNPDNLDNPDKRFCSTIRIGFCLFVLSFYAVYQY